MSKVISGYGPKQWIVLVALLFVLGWTTYYTVRIVRFVANTRQQEEGPIRGWMSVKYVAHTHHVPVSVLNEAVGLPADATDRRPLREIARSQNRSLEELQIALSNAIVDFRSSHANETGGQR